MTYDVSVVGAGVIGSSIAYHLAKKGARVAIVDPYPGPVSPAASWASAGGVRRQDRDAREWPLTQEASRRWAGLATELEAPTGFRAGGHLHLAETEADAARVAERVERERAGGIDVELIDGDEARRLAPGIAVEVLAAAYTAGDGQADPRATTAAFLSAARRHGATLVIDTAPPAAGATVLAAGAWSFRLLDEAFPINVEPLQMLLSAAAAPVLEPTLTAEGRPLSLKQLASGGFLIGGGWPGRRTGERAAAVIESSVTGSWQTATEVYAPVRATGLAESWCGLEAVTADGVPLIGWLRPGVFLAAAFCGHGFQLSPAVGRAVADAVLGEAVPELEPFAPRRFSGTPAPASASASRGTSPGSRPPSRPG